MTSTLEICIAFLMAILLVLGGYQFYFLPQKYPLRGPFSLMTKLDESIPFKPRWVWVYSFFYYPFIISVILTITDFRHYAFVAMSFIQLLFVQLLIAYFYPVKTPLEWREYDPDNSLSEKFLSYVHYYDKGGNCFPSMHVGVATLSALHIYSNTADWIGIWAYVVLLIAGLISISTVFTKQHYVADIPAGLLLAFVSFWTFEAVY